MNFTMSKRIRKNKKSLVTIFATLLVTILSMLTFTACSFTNNGGGSNSEFDANGKLRIASPVVEFNPYSLYGSSKVIDDNSGSFTWPLYYYLSSGDDNQLKSGSYDQDVFNYNFYLDEAHTVVYRYALNANAKKPLYTHSKEQILEYFGVSSATDTNNYFDESGFRSSKAYFAVDTSNPLENKIIRVYSPSEKILSKAELGNFRFPDYEVVVDGRYYTFRVELNSDYLGYWYDKNDNYDAHSSFNPFYDISEGTSLFKFSYHTGKSANLSDKDEFTMCDSKFMTYFTNDEGNFMIRFNPHLEAGSTNRYLKVKAISKTDSRADSLYSSTVSFNAYAMSFIAYSPNSTDLTYGGLDYNQEAFYFHSVKTVYDSINNKNYISTITGVFPEGRKITVKRAVPFTTAYDYAFQSWSTNANAENSLALEDTFPDGIGQYNIGTNCIPNALETGSSAFNIVQINPKVVPSQYLEPNNSTNGINALAYEQIENNSSSIDGELNVISHASLDGYKFYANFAKVRNFRANGTFFAGDNFFTGASQYIEAVTISLYNANGLRILIASELSITGKVTAASLNERFKDDEKYIQRVKDIEIVFNGAEFSIVGLEAGDYLLFEKEGPPLLEDQTSSVGSLPYAFHSPLFETKFIDTYQRDYKVLTLRIDSKDDYISDRQGVGIIGTQYAESSNLQVNLYQVTDGSDPKEIDGTNLKLLQDGNVAYEIIRSVSSYEDANGYITTNVILSILLPSNATLVGYNTETLNNRTMMQYTNVNGKKYISTLVYNANKLTYEADSLFSYETEGLNPNNIIKDVTGAYYTYKNGDTSIVFVYDHKSTASGTTNYYYNEVKTSTNGDEYKVLVQSITGETSTWSLITYKKVSDDRITVGADNKTILVDNVALIEANDNIEANEVSTIVSVYKTQMQQSVKNQTNDVYVYYDVKYTNGFRFYTSPIAKQIKNEGGESNFELYFKELTNFADLASKQIIMLGSDILSYRGNDPAVKAFKEAMGAKLISYCYYYVQPVGEKTDKGEYESTKVIAKQYITDESDQTQQVQVTTLYYKIIGKDGKVETVEYKGQANSVPVKDGDKIIYLSSLHFLSFNGEVIDKNYFIDDYIYDITGTLHKRIDKFIDKGKYNFSSHGVLDDVQNGEAGFGYLKPVYTKDNTSKDLIRYEYNLYLIDDNGNITIQKLYFDEKTNKYYKIEKENVYVNVVDENNEVSTVLASSYKPSEAMDIVLVTDDLTNAKGMLTVKTINNVEQFSIYNGEIQYKAFLIPSFYVADTKTVDGQEIVTAETRYYFGVKDNVLSLKTKDYHVVTTIRPSVSTAYYYTVSGAVLGKDDSGFIVDAEGRKIIVYSDDDGNYYYGKYNSENKNIDIFDKNGNPAVGLATIPYITLDSKTESKDVIGQKTSLVRSAQILGTNIDITLFGKYVLTNDASQPKVYPSFSNLNTYTEEEAFTILKNPNNKDNDLFSHYYTIDYTSPNIVKEGFPGITILAGPPYPNPVLYFSVRHKSYDTPVINLSFDIKEAYFVEILGTNIKTEDSSLINDFSTYSFKDTLTNLTLNDYIDKTFYVLDAKTLKPIVPYIKKDGIFIPKFYVEKDGVKVPVEGAYLTIQDVGLNDGKTDIYYKDVIGANNNYVNAVYQRYIDEYGNVKYKTLNYETDVLLWRSDSTKLEQVPVFDIHSYTQGQDGIIYFNSGSSNNPNTICFGLSGINSGATNNPDGMFNYDEVLVAGVTNAYRTKSDQVTIDSNLIGYWQDKHLSILDAYNSKDAYFLTGRESAIFIASPIVQLNDDAGANYIYMFKEWQVYTRYNSEVLFYNRGITENLVDRYNAILRFTSEQAGYFVILPVYERVYTIDIGSAVIDGAINQGGGISVSYDEGYEIDGSNFNNNDYKDEFYLLEYYKQVINDKEGYYYSDLTCAPYLYFTGDFNNGKPKFEIRDDIYCIRYNKSYGNFSTGYVNLYFQMRTYVDGSIAEVKPLTVLTSLQLNQPGVVELNNQNGYYEFYYNELNGDGSYTPTSVTGAFGHTEGFYSSQTGMGKFEKVINYTFSTRFFYDTISDDNADDYISLPLYYDKETREFYSINLNFLNSKVSQDYTFTDYLLYYNLVNNSHLFDSYTALLVLTTFLNGVFPEFNAGNYNTTLENTFLHKVAKSVTDIFNVVNIVRSNTQINGMYVSANGSLKPGEIAVDKDGNLYSTMQFKTSYITRDTYVQFNVTPDAGYRLEGWYKCVYDEQANAWFTTDEKVDTSPAVFSDEIYNVYKSESRDEYFYVTDYVEISGNERTYYFDAEKTKEAIVPSRMLNKVRGYFINRGTADTPNYIQVYQKTSSLATKDEYYFDEALTIRVDDSIEVKELSFIDAINTNNAVNDLYTLSGVVVYKQGDRFYRTKTEGNIICEGNTLTVKKLHSNVRYVAKFIEVYNEYIFAEDEDSSGIDIKAIYYNNSDPNKDENSVIRTDINGLDKTQYDKKVENLDNGSLSLYENKSDVLNGSYMAGTFTIKENNQNKTYQRYPASSVNTFNTLCKGFNNPNFTGTYRVQTSDEKGDPDLNKLALRSMYFDVKTTVYIVVSVKADFELTIHSLGLNSSYTIEPIVKPTDEFVKYNKQAKSDEKADYLYYIFKISYDRDPANEYANYIVHENRGESMPADVLAGNYFSFYNEYFDLYDCFGNIVSAFIIAKNNGNVQTLNADEYLDLLVRNKRLNSDVAKSLKGLKYNNISELMEELCKATHNYGGYYIKEAKTKTGTALTTPRSIFDYIKKLYAAPGLIYSGQRNFVNLSTIPVYNFTVQTLTIDGYQKNSTDFIYDKDGKLQFNYVPYENGMHLINGVFATAGTNDRTFLGSATEKNEGYTYLDGYKDQVAFDKHFVDLEYAENGENKTLLADLAFAKDSIVLFDGVEGLKEGYGFVGWFEQKYNRDTKEWSSLVLMSTDLNYPYLSLATSDTVIVAVCKKIAEVSFTYETDKMLVEFPNGNIDSLGNQIEVTTNDKFTTIKGDFFFDSEFPIAIVPTGGYRFDAINATVNDRTNKVDLSKNARFANINGESVAYNKISLNGVIYLSMPIEAMVGTYEYTSVQLEFTTKKLTLVHIEVDNFYTTSSSSSSYRHWGYNFALYDISNPNAPRLFVKTNNQESDFLALDALDSAQNQIAYSRSDNKLILSGYFDSELNGKLALITYKQDSASTDIFGWYVNGYTNPTSDYSELASSVISERYKYSEFVIWFEYQDELIGFNDRDKFALSIDNAIYVVKAQISATSDLTIKHSYVDNINGLSTIGSDLANNTSSLVSFSGTMIKPDNSTVENGSFETANKKTYSFTTDSLISLSIKDRFVSFNDNLYVFVGWFKCSGGTSSVSTLISTNTSIDGIIPSGIVEAKYVKAVRVDISSNSYGKISIEKTNNVKIGSKDFALDIYGFSDLSSYSYNYVLAGADLVVTATPNQGYSLNAFDVTPSTGISMSTDDGLNGSKVLTIYNLTVDALIEANFELGAVITINQTLYNSILMNQVGSSITNTYTLMEIEGKIQKLLSQTVSLDTLVKFSVDTDACPYFFVGWFIDGEIVSKDKEAYLTIFEKTIDKDFVIEARFVPYVRVSVNGSIEGSSSSISSFTHRLEYFDMRLGVNSVYTATNASTLRVPAGTVVTLNETRDASYEGNPYAFTAWKLTDSQNRDIQTFSFGKTAQVSLTKDLERYNTNDGGAYIKLVAEYTKTTTLNIEKSISIKDIDIPLFGSEYSDLFSSYFDIIVTYTNRYGNSETVNLSSNKSITGILIMRDTPVYVRYEISSQVSNRYYLESLSFMTNGIKTDITTTSSDEQVISVSNKTSITISAKFSPSASILITNELDGNVNDNEDLKLELEYTANSKTENQDILSNYTFIMSVDGSFTIKAPYVQGYTFVGWFVNGTYLHNDEILDGSSFVHDKNMSIVAKYVSTTNVNIVRRVDGEDSVVNSDLKISANGTIYNDIGGVINFEQSQVNLSELGSIAFKAQNHTTMMLSASNIVGFKFVGFEYTVDGSTPKYLDKLNGKLNLASIGLNGSDVTIYAVYLSEYAINYNITTLNNESGVSNIGGSIVNQTSFFTTASKNITFQLNIASGYEFAGMYVNGEFVEGSTSYVDGQIVSIDLSDIFDLNTNQRSNVAVELCVKQISTLGVRIEVQGTTDPEEIMSALNIDISGFTVNINGEELSFTDFVNALYAEATLSLYDLVSLSISYNGNTDVVAIDDTIYNFVGFYLYDGKSTASSTALFGSSNSLELSMSDNLTLVARYQENGNLAATNMVTRFDVINDADNVQTYTSLDGMDIENGILSLNGNEYMFVGYYVAVNDLSSATGVKYIKLESDYASDLSKYQNIYSLVIGRFVKLNKVSFDAYSKDAVSLITNVVSNIYVSDSVLGGAFDSQNSTYNMQILSGSLLNVKYIAKEGFTTSKAQNSDIINNDVVNGSVSSPINTKVTLDVAENKIIDIKTEISTENQIVINNISYETEVEVVVNSNFDSSVDVIVRTSNANEPETKYTADATNNANFTASSNSVLNIKYNIDARESFDGFTIVEDGVEKEFASDVHSLVYYINVTTKNLQIIAEFSVITTAFIDENDYVKGNANLTNEDKYTLSVNAHNNYYIADILFAEVTGNTIGEYKSFLNDASALTGIIGSTILSTTMSDSDDAGKKLLAALSLEFIAERNVAIKVVYKHYSMLSLKSVDSNNQDVRYTFYLTEEELSTLSTNSLKALISNITDASIKANLNYEATNFNGFVYNGDIFNDSSSPITLLDKTHVTIELTFVTSYDVEFNIETDINKVIGNNTYGVPTDGLQINTSNSTLVSGINQNLTLTIKPSTADNIFATDSNSYFEFIGYYSNGKLVTTSDAFMFTYEQFTDGTLTKNADGKYALTAVFKEKLLELVVTASYEGFKFALSNNNGTTYYEPNTTLNRIVYTNGNVSFILNDRNEVVITYPVSLTNLDSKFTITASDFNQPNNQDYLLPFVGRAEFFEKTLADASNSANNKYYRFYSYQQSNNQIVGDLYNNVLEINLKDYTHNEVITANAKKLYVVEFAYNYFANNFSIALVVINPYTNQELTLKTASNEASFEKALLSAKVEEGTLVKTVVDLSSYDVTGQFAYNNLLYSTTNMLSSRFGSGNTLGGDIPTTKEYWANIANNLSMGLAYKYFVSSANTDVQLSAFNLVAKQNIAILADFLTVISNERSYILSEMNNIDYEQLIINNNSNISFDNIQNGYGFTYVVPNTDYDFTIGSNYTDMSIDNIYINNNGELENTNNPVKGNTGDNLQTNIHVQNKLTGKLVTDARNLPKTFEQLNAETVYYSSKDISVSQSYDSLNSSKYTISTTLRDGYFFKGFLVISSSYQSKYSFAGFGGESLSNLTNNYTFVNNFVKSGNTVSAEVNISGKTSIFAIFEPKVYVVTLDIYEYLEDKTSEADRLSKNEIDAAIVNGSMLAQRGVDFELALVSKPYKTFVGFASPTSDVKAQIKQGAAGFGDNITLEEYKAKPGALADGSYEGSSTNKIKIPGIDKDVTLRAYYVAMSYELTIDLAEVLNAYNVSNSANPQEYYLTYADNVRKDGWKNPSAGTYTINTNIDSSLEVNGKATMETTGTYNLVIADDDPYVYSCYDENGTNIGYPVKVLNSMVDIYAGTANNYIPLNFKSTGNPLRPTNEITSRIEYKYDPNIDESIGGRAYQCGFNGFAYIDQTDDGFTLENLYNFVYSQRLIFTRQFKLNSGLFSVNIDGENYDSATLTSHGFVLHVDDVNMSLRITKKITATEYGFPVVEINMTENVDSPIKPYFATTVKEGKVYANKDLLIQGFNQDLFTNEDFMKNDDYKVGNIDVNVLLVYRKMAKRIDPTVTIQGAKTLSSKNNTSTVNLLTASNIQAALSCTNQDCLKELGDNHSHILAYYLVITKDGQFIANILKNIAETYKGLKVAETALSHYNLLLEATASKTEKDSTKIVIANQQRGNILGLSEFISLINFINTYSRTVHYDIDTLDNLYVLYNSLLTYRVVDVYALAKEGVSPNFFESFFNADDMLGTEIILNHHYQAQINHLYKGLLKKLFKDKPQTAEKGFDYFMHASMNYGNSYSGDSFITSYDNEAFGESKSNATNRKPSAGQSLVNGWKTFVGNNERFNGTYNRLIMSKIMLTQGDFANTQINSVIPTITINAGKSPIVCILRDYNPIPVVNAFLGLVFVGGSNLLLIVDGIILISNKINKDQGKEEHKTVFEWAANWF